MSNYSVPASAVCQVYTNEQSITLSGRHRKPVMEMFQELPGKLQVRRRTLLSNKKRETLWHPIPPPITERYEQFCVGSDL